MERPKISDYTKDLLASYDQLSDYSCNQDKFIDQLEAEKKWISVDDRMPICYKTGDWDGKMSDLVLCQDEKGEYHLANCYDYGDTNEWYDKDDFGLWVKIVKWKQIIDD